MTELAFKVEPETDAAKAHRFAMSKIFGQPVEKYEYNKKTGEIRITTRAIAAFGVLESEDSKTLKRIMDSLEIESDEQVKKRKLLDDREISLVRGESKLVDDRGQLERERKEFEESKQRDTRGVVARIINRGP